MQIPILGMEGSEDDQELYLILAYHWNNYSIRGIESFPEYEYRSIKEIPLDIVGRWNIKDYMYNTSLSLTFVMFRYNDKYWDVETINGLYLRGEIIRND